MFNAKIFVCLVANLLGGHTANASLTTDIDGFAVETHDGEYRVIFTPAEPKPGKVYKVVFVEYKIVPSGYENIFDAHCLVELEEIPGETTSLYDDVVEFRTSIHSLIFAPHVTDEPMDAIFFERTFVCIEYDDMQIPKTGGGQY